MKSDRTQSPNNKAAPTASSAEKLNRIRALRAKVGHSIHHSRKIQAKRLVIDSVNIAGLFPVDRSKGQAASWRTSRFAEAGVLRHRLADIDERPDPSRA